MFIRKVLLIIISMFSLTCVSQTQEGWEEAFRQLIDAEETESSAIENVYEELSEIADHPINLNQASREDLEKLPFLTVQQVEELLAYIHRYGVIRSRGELQMISSLDAERRHLLSYFIYIGEPAKKNNKLRFDSILYHSRHQLSATVKVPLYTRRGDRDGYLGARYRHSIRYQLTYHDRLKFGLTGAQDAGEPFFSNRNNWGYDHYSYYLQLKELGNIKNLCLGMYKVQLGKGLIINGGFYLGKLSSLQSMGRSSTTLKAHSSRSANDYLRGAAATIRLHRNWDITAFASYRPLDATLNKDSTARTLLTSSYHRTQTEMSKKNNTHETDLGGSIRWRKKSYHVNLNYLYTHLDRLLRPEKENAPYRRYIAEGNDFMNLSLDYGYTNSRFSLSGEVALNKEGALATIHQCSFRLKCPMTLMLLHRYYDKRYTALHAQSFSEGSNVQNEHGIYAGLIWQPSFKWTLNGYVDYAHFTWKRYQVSMPSDAFDTMILMRAVLTDRWRIEGRYRFHLRQKDNSQKTYIVNQTEHLSRLRVSYETPSGLSLQTQFDGISVSLEGKNKGWMISEQITYQWRWLQLYANATVFQTDNYASRLYLYERPLPYNFSSIMLYGKGIRYAFMTRTEIGKHLLMIVKLGVTNYFDRQKISSSWQEINGSSQTDIDIHLRITL
jgi:hypothetical protein